MNRAMAINTLLGEQGSRVFSSHQEYETFRTNFEKKVRPELERHREARRRSEERAKRHIVG